MLGLTLAGAAVLGATAAGYQTFSSTGRWYGRAFTGLPAGSKQLALTFDDGPNDPHTLDLLDVLAKHEVKATFFLIGRYVRRRPDILAEIANRGHVIGNHTFTHPLLTVESAARLEQEIADCRDAITQAVGVHSNLFRPPWGGRRPGTFKIIRSLGFDPVLWNSIGYDWRTRSAAEIERKVLARIRGGNVILLHDGGHLALGTDRSKTVQAVAQVIPRLKSQGYEFATVPEMMSPSAAPDVSSPARTPLVR